MTGKKTEAPTPSALPEGEAEGVDLQEMPPAVVVTKQKDEAGNINVDVQAVGGIEPTEIQTILELGVARWRSLIGLGPKTG